MKVIGIGDNVCDKYVHLQKMFPGGQTINFAVYARMLGADSSYMGVFGSDEVAGHIINTLDELGVEYGRCRHYEGGNGFAKVDLVDGDRVFLGSNKGGVSGLYPLVLTKEDLEYISGFSIIHTSNNSYLDSQLKKLAKTKVAISYDFSGQWMDEERVRRVAPYASYVFLSCGSIAMDEAKQVCRNMKKAGCKMIIATRGSKGALLYDGSEFYEQEPKLVEAIDTLGAGDSFAAAFLLSFSECIQIQPEKMRDNTEYYRMAIKKSMERGAEFAAQICLIRGAFGHGITYTE